ncbi:MAG: transposase [Acidobacteriota bacterium]|nr:transposase [Acidobacteriota bacterium]
MAMGRRKKRQQATLWIETSQLAEGPGHPFYSRLNSLLETHGFDGFVEQVAAEFYAETMGRPSMPPSVYFRLLLIGYFEGLDSERAIARRLADSLSLRHFCGFELTDSTPDHSTLSRTRRLLSTTAHQKVFDWVLAVLLKAGLLRGKTLGVDATTLEANAAMRSIVRRDSGESYPEYLQQLAEADGAVDLSRRELARKDRTRKNKASNKDWESPDDPDAKITRMKDGRTHLAHKAEHAVDLETGAVVAVTVQPADRGDTSSQEETLEEASERLTNLPEEELDTSELSTEDLLQEVVADRGYHSNAVIDSHRKLGIRSYIAEPKRSRRRWRGRTDLQQAVYANRRRMRGNRGRTLGRLRAERVERSSAHCYETGGLRRIYLRGRENIRKRIVVHVAAFNLGLVLRAAFGAGTPRGLRALAEALSRAFGSPIKPLRAFLRLLGACWQIFQALPQGWGNPLQEAAGA